MEEVSHMQPQRMRHEKKMSEFHLCASLHSLDRRPVHAARAGKGFLRHVHTQTSHADAVTGVPAGVENPLGLFGWHTTNRSPHHDHKSAADLRH
jgi:hypothetical protein